MSSESEEIQKELESLQARLREREAALPAHSVRPDQILALEELEAAISKKKQELEQEHHAQ